MRHFLDGFINLDSIPSFFINVNVTEFGLGSRDVSVGRGGCRFARYGVEGGWTSQAAAVAAGGVAGGAALLAAAATPLRPGVAGARVSATSCSRGTAMPDDKEETLALQVQQALRSESSLRPRG